MARLTAKECELICSMCCIADAQGRDDEGRGEGDYQDWTDADFKRADAIHIKMAILRKKGSHA